MAGIFGPTGRETFRKLQQDRGREAAARGQQAGTLTPNQMLGQAGSFLGLGIQNALDGVPPEVVRANKLEAAQAEALRSGANPSDPVAFNEALAETLTAQGLTEEAMQVAGEAERIRRERVEERNIESLIASRQSAKEQARLDELERESREAEAARGRDATSRDKQLDRESRERIAAMKGAAKASKGSKPKVSPPSTASDRKQAQAAIIDAIGEDDWQALKAVGEGKETEADDMVAYVAQQARDFVVANPGYPYSRALEDAVEEARANIGEDESTLWGIFGEEKSFNRPTQPGPGALGDAGETLQSRAAAILGN